jgi:hypothetical protein
MRRTLATLLAVAGVPATAHAGPVDDHPAIITAVTVGAAGSLATSIGALVYAIQDRSFHSAWIPTTFIAAAISVALSGALIYDAAQSNATIFNVGGAVLMIALSAWPTAWVLKSSLSDVEPGARFTAEPDPGPEAL